jgi:hypothetical protein
MKVLPVFLCAFLLLTIGCVKDEQIDTQKGGCIEKGSQDYFVMKDCQNTCETAGYDGGYAHCSPQDTIICVCSKADMMPMVLGFGILIGAVFIFLVWFQLNRRKSEGTAHKIDAWGTTMRGTIDKEYTVWGKPKHITFLTIFIIIVVLAHLALTVHAQLNPGGPFPGFTWYTIAMYAVIVTGLILFWRVNVVGYYLICIFITYDLIIMAVSRSWAELVVWIYPVIGMFRAKDYFFANKSQSTYSGLEERDAEKK